MKLPKTRPLSITSPGFSTMGADRPFLGKSASDSNLKGDANANGGEGTDTGSDLNREVATLSNKLISAINHQTKLDDSLAATKHELELSKARVRQLEVLAKEHADMMAKGLLVERKEVETETQRLRNRLKEEAMQRGQAEKDKRHIEQELENLTTALFDEANKMVSAARKERDAVDRKNDQLRTQLADTESLLASHQEQLAELKGVMAQMTKEREENENGMSTGTPNTPRLASRHSKESLGRIFEALSLVPNASNIEDVPPCPPTALINLVHPVLRHDTASYRDFCEVLTQPKPGEVRSSAGRLSGGSLTSIQSMGLGMGLSMSSPGQSASAIGSSLFGMKKRADPGSTTHSPTGSTSSPTDIQAAHLAALKESKFFKRVMMEDIEPTLRLDCAPGLSWLARRNVTSAITEGSLVVDPMPTSPRVTIFACALCGENQADEQHARTHRMRISDSPNAQRYPLCWYCTSRLRCVCDFMAFLRTLKEGLWKCESEGDRKHAWEESVKLREAMFWARIGGGVIFSVHSAAFREFRDESMANGQTETPPRTPVLANILDDGKLSIPKRRKSQINPFLTPEKQRIPSPLDLSALSNKTVNGMPIAGPGERDIKNERVYEVVEIDTRKQSEAPVDDEPVVLAEPALPAPKDTPLPSSPTLTMRPNGETLTLKIPYNEPITESATEASKPVVGDKAHTSPTVPGGW